MISDNLWSLLVLGLMSWTFVMVYYISLYFLLDCKDCEELKRKRGGR